MISAALDAHPGDRPLLLWSGSSGGRESWGDVRERVATLAARNPHLRGARVGLRAEPTARVLAWLLALDRLGATVYLFPPSMGDDVVGALSEQLGVEGLVDPGSDAVSIAAGEAADLEPEVVLFTSGTTGLPKAARHTWASIAARVHRAPALAEARWLLTYHLSAFAGLQVLLHALLNGGSLALGAGSPAELARVGADAAVSHVSGTPTFFRFLLGAADPTDLARWAPAQLTLGGEAVDQPVLDQLRATFPAARITHIYASTEMGACFSVHDGRAGFPASYLESEDTPVWMAVRDGELFVRSAAAMRGYVGQGDGRDATGLFPTGDLVAVTGDRVLFLGRRSERINVGGNKVFPREVEEVVLEVAGVRAVRVSGEPSSLVGQIVRADVVLDAGAEPAELRRRILARCRERLLPYKVPRVLAFVAELAQTSGKIARSP